MAVNSTIPMAQQTSWHFLLATDGVGTQAADSIWKWWRVVVLAEKQRGFVGWEMKEGGIMINETEIANLMMDTKRNRW
jgi:hypothetical protein